MSTISRIGGGPQCSQIQAYPPAAMTANLTNITTSTYGTGYYIATSSTDVTTSAHLPFNTLATANATITGYFQGNISTYSTTSPYTYNGSSVTTDVNNVSYPGVWLQIQLPYSIIVSSYYMSANANGFGLVNTTPTKWWLLASKDGINWTLISTVTGNNSASVSTNVSTITAYSYYRIIINSIILAGNPNYGAAINNLTFYGTQASLTVGADGELGVGITDPVQSLEVAGNAIINGNISAGNLGMFRNILINGAMQVNQRRWSSTMTTVPAVSTAASVADFVADRWNVYRSALVAGAQAAFTPSAMLRTDLPFVQSGLTNYIRMGRASGNTLTNGYFVSHALESQDSIPYAGQTMTVSFFYRCGANFSGSGLSVRVLQGTGTDENPRSVFTGNTTITNTEGAISTNWTRYTATFTLSSTLTQICLVIGCNNIPSATAAGASDNFDITGIQLEKGTIATPFEFKPFAIELQLCQRYFNKTYDLSVVPGAISDPGSFACVGNALGYYIHTYSYPCTMRAIPTISLYSPKSGALNNFTNGSFNYAAIIQQIGMQNVQAYTLTGPANSILYGHIVASAEL